MSELKTTKKPKSKYQKKIAQRAIDAKRIGLPANTPYPIILAKGGKKNW